MGFLLTCPSMNWKLAAFRERPCCSWKKISSLFRATVEEELVMLWCRLSISKWLHDFCWCFTWYTLLICMCLPAYLVILLPNGNISFLGHLPCRTFAVEFVERFAERKNSGKTLPTFFLSFLLLVSNSVRFCSILLGFSLLILFCTILLQVYHYVSSTRRNRSMGITNTAAELSNVTDRRRFFNGEVEMVAEGTIEQMRAISHLHSRIAGCRKSFLKSISRSM